MHEFSVEEHAGLHVASGVEQITSRRHRYGHLAAAAGAVALAAGLSMPAVASPARAGEATVSTILIKNVAAGTCLDANGDRVGNYGAIMQWEPCSPGDTFQQWQPIQLGGAPDSGGGEQLVQFENVGATQASKANGGPGLCLDAHAQQVYSGGAIIQYACDSSDLYQQWDLWAQAFLVPGGSRSYVSLANVGASLASEATGGPDLCLDANASQVKSAGAIIQYPCDGADNYQIWSSLAAS